MSNQSNLPKHPDTGFHYIFVLPDIWGSFVDYYAGYQILTQQIPWTSLVTSAAFNSCFEAHRDHEDVFFVLWEEIATPRPHRCFTAPVYKEAIDDNPDTMLPDHLDHWRRVGALAPGYDGFLTHTPRMADAIGRGMSLPTHVFPAGWSPEAMGMPRQKHIHHQLTYWGSMAGRRWKLIPFLKESFGSLLFDGTSNYGRNLLGILEQSKAALYVAHSSVWSFSTWRLWQGIATNTPHIAEPGDSWPFVAGKHYIPFSPFNVDDEKHNRLTVELIANMLGEDTWLQNIADAAHADLADRFTLKRCVEDYLVPASIQIRDKRSE